MSLRSKPPLAIHLEQILLLLMQRAAARGRPRPYRSYQYFLSLRSEPLLAIYPSEPLLLLMRRAAARGRPRPCRSLIQDGCRMGATNFYFGFCFQRFQRFAKGDAGWKQDT